MLLQARVEIDSQDFIEPHSPGVRSLPPQILGSQLVTLASRPRTPCCGHCKSDRLYMNPFGVKLENCVCSGDTAEWSVLAEKRTNILQGDAVWDAKSRHRRNTTAIQGQSEGERPGSEGEDSSHEARSGSPKEERRADNPFTQSLRRRRAAFPNWHEFCFYVLRRRRWAVGGRRRASAVREAIPDGQLAELL